LKLPSLGVVLLIASSGCYHYVPPPPPPQPISQEEAVNRSYRFAESQGYRPVGVRNSSYHPDRAVWRVNVGLGAPSCGVMKVELNAFDGRVLKYDPKLHPCSAPPPKLDPDL
jgi:hypothetical protein